MNDFLYKIYKWYNKNERDLPWRNTQDPYKIWISEIILQQTRVEQGTSYYLNFIKMFPTLTELVNANEDEVLKLWQGLGYYSRARNLHATAKEVHEKHHGIFPDNYTDILALKGIGSYTAAAIASIAFGLPRPALDGNIYRVLARYFGIFDSPASGKGKKVFLKLAEEIIPNDNPGFHNQALMEFGALQCVPKSPDCSVCPVKTTCFAFQKKQVENLPVKSPKLKQRTRYFYYYFIESGEKTWLEKRTGDDIWKNLHQFPLVETENELSEKEILVLNPSFLNGFPYNIKYISGKQKHILSHQVIFARLIHIEVNKDFKPRGSLIPVTKEDVIKFAVPRLMELLIEKNRLF
ncbi:A/G-specific adenine glycosylase [Mariniphaga sp.]|uniref:A/G-specific adenine glycosylase n=1 Tax=Mariniphaga sp. TaxID=1954475 RepID=UPI003569F700